MGLTVEDGSGLAAAESYVSVSDAVAYASARGLAFPASPIAPAEQALRRATAWLDGRYRSRFPGARANGRAQALEWPRIGARDREGEEVAPDEIPVEIVSATIEAAVRELASPGSLSPDVTVGQIEKRVKVEGIEVEYANPTASAYDQRPTVTVVDGILASLLAGSASPYVARAVRA